MPSQRVLDSQPSTHMSRLIGTLAKAVEQSQAKIPDGQFGFNAVVETENTRLSTDTVDMEYDVPFDDDFVPNEAEIRIYNLSDKTIANFKKDATITITSGYKDDTGVIFKGNISNVKTEHNGVETITTVNAIDHFDISTVTQDVQMSYSEGTTASTILNALLDSTGLAIEVFKPARDYTYQKSVTVSGALGEQIKKYAEVCGDSVWVNKQRVYCRPLMDGDNIHFTVAPNTGMIDSPQGFTEKVKSEIYQDTVTGYDIKMLAQHRMTTAAIVDVNARDTTGSFRVKSGTHTYDGLHATTEIHAVAMIDTEILPEETYTGDSVSATGGSDSEIINTAVQWAVDIANDDSHWYSQEVRWGASYDCSSFVISAYQYAGVPVKTNGATYTGDMYNVFLKCGFKDVTSSCNLKTGAGLLKGDVLLNVVHHTAMVQEDGGLIVHASGHKNGIVANRSYYNYPWNYVLRYNDPNATGGKWITGHTATSYGTSAEDDNGICGWLNRSYSSFPGCHVAIPTYCVKQARCYNKAWQEQDFPEYADGYGTVIEVKNPRNGKTVITVAADSGDFGPHNHYNHNTALDLPPRTRNTLEWGSETGDVEYRILGHLSSWDGHQITREEI